MNRKILTLLPAFIASLLLLAACGGGGGGGIATPVTSGEAEAQEQVANQRPPLPDLPAVQISDATAALVFYDGDILRIGTDISPQIQLPEVAGRPGVFYGHVRDGEGAASVSKYVMDFADIGEYKESIGLETFRSPPTVNIARGTNASHSEYVARAVQLINESLPVAWHIDVRSDAPPLSGAVPDGQIYVDFAPWEAWDAPGKPPIDQTQGTVQNFYFGDGTRRAAHVWIESERLSDTHMLKVAAHDLPPISGPALKLEFGAG